MKKSDWIAAVTIMEAALAIVVNLATSGGALWLWYLLGVLVVAIIAVKIHDAAEGRRDRQTGGVHVEKDARVWGSIVDSASEVVTPPGSPVSVRMSASLFGKILRSATKIRQR